MIHGTYRFGKKRVACRNAFCTTCGAPRFAEAFRSLIVLHLFFVPLLPLAVSVRWICTSCGKEIDARRPSRPGILFVGSLLGLLLMVIGLITLGQGKEKDTAWGCLLLGPLLIAGMVHELLKKGHHRYEAAKQAVPPLRADQCPYCRSILLSGKPPHCLGCDVDILVD